MPGAADAGVEARPASDPPAMPPCLSLRAWRSCREISRPPGGSGYRSAWKSRSRSCSRLISKWPATSARVVDRVPTRSGLCCGMVRWCSPPSSVVRRRWLPVCRVIRFPKTRSARARSSPTRREGASYRYHFLTHEVETDHFRGLTLLKMAADCITDLAVEVGQRVGLGEDGWAECPGRVPPSGASSTIKINSFMS